MGLRLKFNLVLLTVFVAGLSISGYVSYTLLQKMHGKKCSATAV